MRDQSTNAGVAFFLKQLGGVRNKRGGDEAFIDDGRLWREMPSVGQQGETSSSKGA